MFIFKILLIILIALPVIALASYFYSQMLSFIKVKNSIEEEAIVVSGKSPFLIYDLSFYGNDEHPVLFIDEGVIKEENEPQEFFGDPKDPRLKEFLSKVL